MRGRGGRHTPAEKEAVIIAGNFGQRPEPPADLTERQGEIWREIVASEDPKFFDTGALRALLADYCRHREASEKLTVVINDYQTAWLRNSEAVGRYEQLLKMRDRETRAVAALARSLRITNQARYTPHAAATAARNAAKGSKPWEMP